MSEAIRQSNVPYSTMRFVVAAGVLFGVFHEKGFDLAGDKSKTKTPQEKAEQIARITSQLRSSLRLMPPIEMVAVNFADQKSYDSSLRLSPHVRVAEQKIGKGWLGWGTDNGNRTDYYAVAEDCLSGSAYDPLHSEIRGEANGNISSVAALAIDPQNSDIIHVKPSGNINSELVLRGRMSGLLEPNDPSSQGILEAYGCHTTAPKKLIAIPITEDRFGL